MACSGVHNLAVASLSAFAVMIGGAGSFASATSLGGGPGAAGNAEGSVGGGLLTTQICSGTPGLNTPISEGMGDAGYSSARDLRVAQDRPASGAENAQTTVGVSGGTLGAPLKSDLGGKPPPPLVGQQTPSDAAKAARGVTEDPASSTVGLAVTAPDGVSTKIVKPRPCGVAAHETDGTTTCVGIPTAPRRQN